MAEPAQPETGAAMSPTDIKQERDILEGLDFAMSPQITTKRPFDDLSATDEQSKRVKTENEGGHGHESEIQNGTQKLNGDQDGAEESLEDGLALLVQNALSGVGDLVEFSQDPEISHTTNDPMDVDGTATIPEPSLPPPPIIQFVSEPEKFLRDASRHALGNLAISTLLVFSQSPFDETLKFLRDTTSQHHQSFCRLRPSFQSIRQIYSTKPILSADELDMQDNESRTIIELTNLATIGTWLIEGGLKPISDAHEHFHTVFPGQMSDLAPDVMDFYLALKTQLAIEKLLARTPEQQPDAILNEVLVNGLEDKLRGLHGGFELTTADQGFIASVRSRREALQGEAQHQAEAAAVREKHPVNDMMRNFCTHVKSRLSSIPELGMKLGLTMPQIEESAIDMLPNVTGDGDLDLDDLSSFFEKTTSGLVQNALAGLTEEEAAPAQTIEEPEQPTETPKSPLKAEPAAPQTNGKIDFMTDYKELEALVAESTSNYVKTTLHGLSPVPYQPTVPTSTAESMAAQPSYLSHLQQHHAQHPYYSYTQAIPEPPQPQPQPGDNLPPNQTFPSAILYDKARQAALSKSSAHTRREGLHSTRRPWTQEEEKALMAGLDMVKGPHWSQILTLFGPNGTISDILKDRTQVQLKDKARNLKLFFLKTNSEMPYYLQAVTGELKTRAPTQAARKEAEERARLNSEEEQARLQGILTLAGGLHHPPQSQPQGRATGSPANAVGTGVVTPAQAASAAQAASTQNSAAHHGHTAQAAHMQPAVSQGYPVTSLPQSRPSMQTTAAATPAQQALQQATQSPSRPQTQPPPQTARPQSQHQHQHHQQQQPQALPQSQPHQQQHTTPMSPAQHQQAAQARSHSSTPVGQAHPPPAQQAHIQPSVSASQAAHTMQPQYPPPTHHQTTHSTPPAPVQTQPSQVNHQASTPQPHNEMHDNAAEAALLQGLQAAVAESM